MLYEDLRGAGYNVHQSEIAIGSGGFFGKGFTNGTQNTGGFVPEQSTDFIFCAIGEDGGSAVNVIAQGTQLQGNMITASDCRIDGAMRGNIESKAKIIVGRTGVVEGNIKCANIEIEGRTSSSITRPRC